MQLPKRQSNLPILFAGALLAILAGCSGKPSTGELRSELQVQLDRLGMADVCEVDKVERVNGFEKDDKTYVADVKYDLVFKKSLQEWARDLEKKAGSAQGGQFAAGLGVLAMKMQFGDFTKGQRTTQSAKLTLIKTENGWRIAN